MYASFTLLTDLIQLLDEFCYIQNIIQSKNESHLLPPIPLFSRLFTNECEGRIMHVLNIHLGFLMFSLAIVDEQATLCDL